ncbi:MAG TPA: hypothetical protein VHX42_05130 [Candidatus Babeliales bacterium]|jgi:ankyrin repeat protein|nr:hypothetical protein [Candidatus Babeliales bacterium]
MNKKIIISVIFLIPALSHCMEHTKHNDKLIQTSFDRFNIPGIDKKKNFALAQKLLDQKKANPDARKSPEHPTSLMLAIYHNDLDYAHLFLTYGANLNEKALFPGRTQEGPLNILEMEPTGWLREIVAELNIEV